ncbi:protein of unknown function [Taphrina deformans PYCC 5710]|uniref:Uncharacterized protein n=1 Tax=Taphrina deformans (strain PYCC 5710 / ATCC 11124 / CBS 356.35 / IMI 108563 / JCM 9778 / NBRC 8474) TaxID=1097556 RepID=R4XHJ3_TAPDE|nr:protein of unknown function [Taphrina deformans PYCC 5710]|eukprot:CCG83998.1 protein of unknown function [Taphrina deformans PYCC 5710]
MSLDAYKERQDRAFDTFRSKFSLYERVQRPDLPRSNSTVSKRSSGKTKSASSLGDISGQTMDNEELDVPTVPAPQLTFSPQIRKLQTAPWENNMEEPTKTKKSRTSIMRRLRRVTANTKTSSFVADGGPNDTSTDKLSEVVVFADRPQHTGPAIATAADDKPLRTPAPLSIVQEAQQTIAFGPVDPNIVHLRHPVEVIAEDEAYCFMKPSRSTPQIEYELENSPQKKDRMSRMFDGLHFD